MKLATVLLLAAALAGCGGAPVASPSSPSSVPSSSPAPSSPSAPSSPATSPTYDVEALGVPRFVAADYLDLAFIARVSRFRSGIGHSYTDGAEVCRSMKHYFQPRSDVDWGSLVVTAPIAGEITRLDAEQSFGTQVHIRSADQPAFTVILFHVAHVGATVGTRVAAGQPLGTHVGSQTTSDVAISVDTPTGFRLVSWFDAVTEAVFDRYRARGIADRAAMVISRQARDANPLTCSGESFTDAGPIENWVALR